MTRAIYPGSFDPFHNGHCDIARRAAGLFDELIVTVFDAPAKRLLFSTDERIQLAREAVQDVENISIVSYSGLTVKWAERHDVRVIVRGLRNVDDLSFESRIDMANRHMAPQPERVGYLSGHVQRHVHDVGIVRRQFIDHPHKPMLTRSRHSASCVSLWSVWLSFASVTAIRGFCAKDRDLPWSPVDRVLVARSGVFHFLAVYHIHQQRVLARSEREVCVLRAQVPADGPSWTDE